MRILLTYLLIKIYDFISWELKFINCCNLNYDNNNNLVNVREHLFNDKYSKYMLEKNIKSKHLNQQG